MLQQYESVHLGIPYFDVTKANIFGKQCLRDILIVNMYSNMKYQANKVYQVSDMKYQVYQRIHS